MVKHAMNWRLWLILALGLVILLMGWWSTDPALLLAATLVLLYVGLRRRAIRRSRLCARTPRAPDAASPPTPRPAIVHRTVDPGDTPALVDQMLAQGRSSLLLRPQIAATLAAALFDRAVAAFDQAAALVPDGEVGLGRANEREPERVLRVEAFFLDRHPVTNRQYAEFVAAGGYEQMALWDAAIWPAVLEFVDRTGAPGPRYWHDGNCPLGEDEHPVVGVSWHEAAACARWLGKRLPSDAEWVKAAAWPVGLAEHVHTQRRFPWGDAMDRAKANLWGSGPGRIVPVHEFVEGVSVGGIYQLIGNVWEWTGGAFRNEHAAGTLTLPVPMKSIRGGAFDTYFDNQATCQFQSGENPLARRHNIGFRCAISLRDLALAGPGEPAPACSADEATAEAIAPLAEQTAIVEEAPV